MKTLFLKILALILVLQPYQALKASWSTPPVNVPVSDLGKGIGFPHFDSAENLITLYQDATANNAVTAIRILPTGVEAPRVVLSPALTNSERLVLVVSSAGDYLVATWANSLTNQIQASIYTTATGTWSTFQNLGPATDVDFGNLVASFDSSNRATVGWIDDTSGTPVVYSSTLSPPLTGTWTTPVSFTLLPAEVNPSHFSISASGHFVAASWTHQVVADLFYHFYQIDQSAGVPAWTSIDDIDLGSTLVNGPRFSEDSAGNIVAAWQDTTSSDVNAWNSSALGNYVTIASAVSTKGITLQVDQAGRASLVFVTPIGAPSISNQIQSSVLFFSGVTSGDWSPLAILNAPFINSVADVNSLSVDSIGPGHSNFTWAQGDAPVPTTSVINVATLTNPTSAANPGVWSSPTTISNVSEFSRGSSIVENAAGDLLVVWGIQNGMTINLEASKKLANSTWSAPVIALLGLGGDETFIAISSAGRGGLETVSEDFGLSLSVEVSNTPTPPTPPTNLIGIVQKNVFLTQTDRIHLISWTPSTDLTVVAYEVYRNGVLVAIVPAIAPFTYVDHNRSKKVPDTYSVVAISITGGVSTPISIVLQ